MSLIFFWQIKKSVVCRSRNGAASVWLSYLVALKIWSEQNWAVVIGALNVK